MELPKNIIQVGKPDKTHKIFVEDYVVSYIKQLYKAYEEKTVGLALYGKYCEEADLSYYFLYGAAVVEGLENRGPYLSQVEKEEIEDIGKRYFEEYQFLAWCNIKGEPVESFFVQMQGKGIEINGYACFYEKNESMLNYMLINGTKKKEEQAEVISEEKRPARGEWKSSDYVKAADQATRVTTKKTKGIKRKTEFMKVAAAAVFLGLCVIGITTLNDYEKIQDLQVAARQVIASLTEQKLPDVEESEKTPPIDGVSGNVSGNAIAVPIQQQTKETEIAQDNEVMTVSENKPEESIQAQVNPVTETNENQEVDNTPADTEIIATEETTLPIMYTIVKGDTLISICTKEYGTIDNIKKICEMNGIADPDDIKVGQTILLP
ncbi:MAG TPA: LysM peptidoglycan-binding domain-containing protein [Lachnospiraceae bacterium]|nr:LysM peptidoglycan-binding domain-containing protein [Lachnospiraceae bacterium]